MQRRILILTPRFPYPVIGGDKLRIYSIAQGLRAAGFELTLLSFVASQREARFAKRPEITSVFQSVRTVVLPKWRSYLNVLWGLPGRRPLQVLYYHSPAMEKAVRRELGTGKYAAVLAHLIRMAPYVPDRKKNMVRILEMTDALSLNYKRSREYGSKGMLGRIYKIEEERAGRYEGECIQKFDRTVVVSRVDKDHLAANVGPDAAARMAVAPHGIPEEAFLQKPRQEEDNLMVFIGNMRTHQNNDAILYFVKEIYPLIREVRPDAELRVIGASPSREVWALHNRMGIEVTGRVPRVADYAAGAVVSVCPVRIAAGMRGKILESMAMNIPVVSTTVGAAGIEGATSGRHLMLADTPAEFAAAVLRVMSNKHLRGILRENGRRLVRERYRYSQIGRQYAELIKKLTGLSS